MLLEPFNKCNERINDCENTKIVVIWTNLIFTFLHITKHNTKDRHRLIDFSETLHISEPITYKLNVSCIWLSVFGSRSPCCICEVMSSDVTCDMLQDDTRHVTPCHHHPGLPSSSPCSGSAQPSGQCQTSGWYCNLKQYNNIVILLPSQDELFINYHPIIISIVTSDNRIADLSCNSIN